MVWFLIRNAKIIIFVRHQIYTPIRFWDILGKRWREIKYIRTHNSLNVIYCFCFHHRFIVSNVNWIRNSHFTALRICVTCLFFLKCAHCYLRFMCGELPSINILKRFFGWYFIVSRFDHIFYFENVSPVCIRCIFPHNKLHLDRVRTCSLFLFLFNRVPCQFFFGDCGCCLIFHNGRVWSRGILNSNVAYNGTANIYIRHLILARTFLSTSLPYLTGTQRRLAFV